MPDYKKVAQLRTAQQFRDHLNEIGADLPFDEDVLTAPESPLAQPVQVGDATIGNRWCILPMEGWDGTADGKPTKNTVRRWQRFGLSGAKLIWGGEAVAVRHDGRANPNQLTMTPENVGPIAELRQALVDAHEERFGSGSSDDLYIGLQLTHSGRFCRPNDKKRLEPRTAYRHPVLDGKFGITDDSTLLSDDDIDNLIEYYIQAAKLAQQAGFSWVDLKHCHGYLGHEFLSAIERPGRYGGSFENRTRFLRNIVEGVRAEVPGLGLGVRVSAWDWIAFRPGVDNIGEPEPYPNGYPYAFGGDGTGTGIDLAEPFKFLDLLAELNIPLVCITVGSPYYNPHIMRPAMFPPSDGYLPPEDPLVGVARQIKNAALLKQHRPELLYAGTGYSYLQEWLPNVAQHVVREGMIDFVGLGRMVLSYPDLPADVLEGNKMQRKQFCRTFSDCTTGPRNGLVSGCYPLDEFYKESEEAAILAEIKKQVAL
ncbi:MAG: NADH:flavin oxidoreductase [Anaerolineaceae bacterium]|nr:NADH:flavin oxidoreductase [Anaerolineaceae bacterium]